MFQPDVLQPEKTADAETHSGKSTGISPKSEILRVLGLCLGASTISLVQLETLRCQAGDRRDTGPMKPQIVKQSFHVHEGNPKETFLSVIRRLDIGSFDKIVVTGRRFRKFINLTAIAEPEAVEYAYRYVKPEGVACPAIVSAGGETTMVYILDRQGRIANVVTGNKCAAGTGEFFLQQLRRMNVSLETAAQWAATESPHQVSGRCSVFCKSDCTHATNKGIPKAKVTAGLCKMMANKILELLKKVELRNIMITGGTALNQMMIAYLRQEIPGLVVPPEAPCFEALGAALWALDNETRSFPADFSELFLSEIQSFDTLDPLTAHMDQVTFKTMERGALTEGDDCVLGLDVGSTTTKAVLLRKTDDALLASVYLRTDGDPVDAARKCYRHILAQVRQQVDSARITVSGLGVCGSGRQIAGLHALTDGVINEIIAHATAAVYFDPDVDTIFEIGGQDAKYTFITNSVPSDYAMNEACSAGTGSFLEESAFETLGVPTEDIAAIALKGRRPPNFNDQCAAFISSDIKNAIHEGIAHEDIMAGLVYSICMNYTNRVKGNRPVGAKVFMQGGVCYNRAVPLAMAALVGKPIIVPPEPGLMGAFGVALETKKRIELGLLMERTYDLQTLADRTVAYKKPFTCRGGKEKCDRRCEIAVIEIEGKTYPFGGACNRYYNLRQNIRHDTRQLDLVRHRQHLVYATCGTGRPERSGQKQRGRIGLNRSFLVNTYYPLYAGFFSELGFKPVLPDVPSPEGINQKNAPFCYPAELAHGFFAALLQQQDPVEYVFLPHFKAVPAQNGNTNSQVCPFVQGETFFLQATFRRRIRELQEKGLQLLTPLINLRGGINDARTPLVSTAVQMGLPRREAERAFDSALRQQTAALAEMKRAGQEALAELEADPDKIAVIIFARSYNGFVEEAHMGIPGKIASRGIRVLPFDFLSFDEEDTKEHMYWGMGQTMLKAARVVKRHPQLFGTYITNFSCGPDSFLLGYFRDIMGRKPSLTLELDSHTADAGLETRIEAFLDIVAAYRQLVSAKKIVAGSRTFVPARTLLQNGKPAVITSEKKTLSMKDPRVTLLFPSMGRISTQALAAVFSGKGYHVVVHPPSDEAVLKLGRANTSCKECLPLILTTGTLLNYVNNGKRPDEVLVYFMPTGSGPCRFGQYRIFMEDLIRRHELPNVAIFSLTSENSYLGLGTDFQRRGWWAVVVSDVIEDMRSMLLANAVDVDSAMNVFQEEWRDILAALAQGEFARLENQLEQTARRLGRIPLRTDPAEAPKISLAGEIFVRRDDLSRQYLTERLAKHGFASICSPVAEWLFYSDYLMDSGLADYRMTKLERLEFIVKKKTMRRYERRIKSILSRSGLVAAEPVDIRGIIRNAAPYISPNLGGEAILTVGSAMTEVATHTCGVIAIGPFGCMPNRLAESILNETMNRKEKLALDRKNQILSETLAEMEEMPFLAVESDGSPFPQLIDAKLEAFCMRAERLHRRMLSARRGAGKKKNVPKFT